MRSVRVNTDVPATKGSAELNHHNNREHLKEVRDGGGFNGQGLSEEDESRIHEDANGRRIELVQAPEVRQRQQPQPQGPVVQWEQFLPLRSLKVLLVENDDSTRHVVSALLRNCSYEVTAVENGLEAWKVLVDLNKQIDLVLTEVVMPYLSGVGLLSKITSHVARKNIPVIMMSTDDSMGMVFNCLSKGAVDFLVKPIRKNELKNLWQHVWRKCHSSSGSGSESGIHTRKSTKSRSIEGSEDGTGSSDDDNRSIGLTTRDGSDNGSGSQSSWSKRAVELDSSQAISSWDQLKDLPDSTCAQVIHARPESFDNCWGQMTIARECGGEHDKLDAVAMGKDLEIGFPSNPDVELEDPSKKAMHSVTCKNKEKLSDTNPKKVGEKLETRRLNLNCEMENAEARTEAASPTGIVTARLESVGKEVSDDLPKSSTIKDKASYHDKDLPALELSLKRPRDAEDFETSNQERNVLRHSGLSAFSRYNTTMSNANQAPTGIVGSCSPVDISSEAGKPELQSNSNGTPNQRSNASNDDMGSTTNNAFTKLEALSEKKPTPRSTANIHSTSAFQSIDLDHTSSLQPAIPSMVDDTTVHSALAKPRGTHQQVHHHHHYHHHHHHVHNMQQQKQMESPDDPSLRNMVSNVLTASAEGNAANYGSASGSNNKSNGENGSSGKKGSSSAAATEGGKMENDNGISGKCEAGDGSGSGSGTGRASGVDQNRLAQREAALNKFRQKRKERCFEKKVRYQSRKRLAEQRPRVRGQFVRQGVSGNKNEDEES